MHLQKDLKQQKRKERAAWDIALFPLFSSGTQGARDVYVHYQ